MNFELKNIDYKKTGVNLKHTYVIDTEENLTDSNPIEVTCSYLKVGEKMEYFNTGKDGKGTLDTRRIIKDKVHEFRNMTVGGEPVTLPEQFLALPDDPRFFGLMMNIINHILNADTLTEDEEKNSASDTDA